MIITKVLLLPVDYILGLLLFMLLDNKTAGFFITFFCSIFSSSFLYFLLQTDFSLCFRKKFKDNLIFKIFQHESKMNPF